jgi:tRNA modification GTPase
VDPELAAESLRRASQALERLLGRMDAESVLDRLFMSFCIGK